MSTRALFVIALLTLHQIAQAQVIEAPVNDCVRGAKAADPKAFHLEEQVAYADAVLRGTEKLDAKMFEGAGDIQRYRNAVNTLLPSTRSLQDRCDRLPRMTVANARFELLQATQEADRLNQQAVAKRFVSTQETNFMAELAGRLKEWALRHFDEPHQPMLTVRVKLKDQKARQMEFTAFMLPSLYFKPGRLPQRDDEYLDDAIVGWSVKLKKVANRNDILEGSVGLRRADLRIWIGPKDAYAEMANMIRSKKVERAHAISWDASGVVEEFEALKDLVTERSRP